jgi:hypothetical protein
LIDRLSTPYLRIGLMKLNDAMTLDHAHLFLRISKNLLRLDQMVALTITSSIKTIDR